MGWPGVPNTVWNVGRATLTTVMSRIDMMAPITTTPAIFRTAASMWSGRSTWASDDMRAPFPDRAQPNARISAARWHLRTLGAPRFRPLGGRAASLRAISRDHTPTQRPGTCRDARGGPPRARVQLVRRGGG